MIGSLIAEVGDRVTAADGIQTVDETVSVTVDDAGDVGVFTDHTAAAQIRVIDQGRVGWAGGHLSQGAELLERAIGSARVGDSLELLLPAPSPMPSVTTHSLRAARAEATDLLDLARHFRDRLRRSDWLVEVWAERSAGGVQVANTRGVLQQYDQTIAGVGAAIRRPGDRSACRLHCADVDLPDQVRIESLVAEITGLLAPPTIERPQLESPGRVWFRPRAVRQLLRPVMACLMGGSWLEGGDHLPELDPRVAIADDPWAPGRPGSRPIDDDGVVTRPVTLVESGKAVRGLLDLVAGARSGLPSTGHGWRRGVRAPRIGFSNLVLQPGSIPRDDLGRTLGDGLMVPDWEWGPAPNPVHGVFRVPAPWTFLIRGGEVAGRVPGAVLSGNVFELLREVVAIGADPEWVGAASVPSVIVDRVGCVIA